MKTTIAAPAALHAMPAYTPLLDLINDQLVTPGALAERWGYTIPHISRLRASGRHPTWVELPTGGIRYRLSTLVSLELAGQSGPVTQERMELAIAATPGVPDACKARILAHVRLVCSPALARQA